jgi:MoaA/NifB/PqqE/SkfB family radical SAM enzyme
MIEGTMDWLRPESDDQLEKILVQNAVELRWRGLTLTGSEVTLRPDLPDLARRARDHGFEHIRIQTHGTRLADEKYCRELVEAGIDEFFVSITAADADTHDAITGVKGSFHKTVRGLENLEAFARVSSLTNTVITERSYRELPSVVERLGHLQQLVQMEFWTYWPMRETDEKGLVASHIDVLPYLKQAISAARGRGRSVVVKNFPECLLGNYRDALDNEQPKLIIDPEFWPEFMRNGFHQCVHRSYCASQRCLGLNSAYVNKYGWHADLLVPLAVER